MMNHIIHLFITALVNACNLQLINNFQGCIGIKLLLMLGKSSSWNVSKNYFLQLSLLFRF